MIFDGITIQSQDRAGGSLDFGTNWGRNGLDEAITKRTAREGEEVEKIRALDRLPTCAAQFRRSGRGGGTAGW